MKRILIIAYTDLENDPRVNRQIRYLSKHYNISTVGLKPVKDQRIPFWEIQKRSHSNINRLKRAFQYKIRDFENLYWSIYDYKPLLHSLQKETFDLILANDVESLPFALKISKGTRVLLDTHEYAPNHFSDRFVWRFFFQAFNQYICRQYLNKCTGIMTVSNAIARIYNHNYGVEPKVISNATDFFELKPSPVESKRIKLIHHGVSAPNRKIELMINLMDYADERFHLDLMLLPTHSRYHKKLLKMADKRKNVSFIPPVPMREIVPFINSYDISLIIFKPTNITLKYSSFNKFYESLQARLMIVSGNSPEDQVEIMEKYKCGIVSESYAAPEIAKLLCKLTASDIEQYKWNSHSAASLFTSEKNMEKLGQIVADLLNVSH